MELTNFKNQSLIKEPIKIKEIKKTKAKSKTPIRIEEKTSNPVADCQYFFCIFFHNLIFNNMLISYS
jgi:hypothetical protein